ncbi:phosphoenolpyruvate synthase [Leptolyngbya sp. FACHB-16]|uniref:phosphoenolpyruvate synthase n=1 Tax=unclassified Leptolyngbya TaxID=2650499 RepID=UPI001689F1B6|nr:phosphoenolpyruvate synthase [Leptolyngbya sp. FACHB-16]MBD2153492.1 phosphoenolpyruvate synthase [Leptolyngbya sp. FACHB-16]
MPDTDRPTLSINREQALVLWFHEVGMGDVALVGGKNASLGEMISRLASRGVKVPNGFAITAAAYRHFLKSAGVEPQLRGMLDGMDVDNVEVLQRQGQKMRSLILETPFPDDLRQAIIQSYERLCAEAGEAISVAVRSSATAEDLPDASFAGQQDTYLNVNGVDAVLETCHQCFASLFNDRAIAYRTHKGFDHFDVSISVGVQRMVRSDLASAGVMFSIDTETGFQNAVLLTAAYGLGESVVQGSVNPDEYIVFKPTLKEGFDPILSKRLGSKAKRMVYATSAEEGRTRTEEVSDEDRDRFALNRDEIIQLARWACTLEDYYSEIMGRPTPMDVEWAKDGQTGELFVVQARPETVQSQKQANVLRSYHLKPEAEGPKKAASHGLKPLATGRAVGDRIGQGTVRVIRNLSELDTFQAGEVLVTERTDPDWEPILKKAGAIVTDQGGRTCHAAIIARELGIPAIVGCNTATDVLSTGQAITVSCAEGDEGRIYEGTIPFEVDELALDNLPQTRTKILMNVGKPKEAFRLASIPSDGVGLARTEFIITNQLQVHPLALLHFDDLKDAEAKEKIAQLTHLYPNKPDYFVDGLVQGIATLAAAFYPNPVIVRTSDFKSNEYANLLGGREFEPEEENPMIGWRGASRYYDPNYREAFGLECRALKRVRDEMGLRNVIPMIPFCRTPEEGRKVLEEMAVHGLQRGENGLQIYVMAELPSNIMLADEFSEIFDGFSIGSNDLTQLTLGLDRDSGLVAHLFDERNPAVKRMVKHLIERAKANGRKVGICGQGPSDYPDFAKFLVELGIDSISLNPDSVLKTRMAIAEVEAS